MTRNAVTNDRQILLIFRCLVNVAWHKQPIHAHVSVRWVIAPTAIGIGLANANGSDIILQTLQNGKVRDSKSHQFRFMFGN
jgi:hypothetical protein